jgi:aminomethyltransferase
VNSVEHAYESLLQTPLSRWHEANGGRMVDFAGWSMPVQYGSIIGEHHQTRRAIGLFDVSHMGRLYFQGAGVDRFLDRLITRKVADVEAGKIRYSLITNESGGILDDILVYHLPGLANEPSYHMMVVNASNRSKIVDWLKSQASLAPQVSFVDRTLETAMIAVQGPLANQVVAKLAEVNPAALPYYTGTTTKIFGHRAVLSRTGYTGEDGCELIVDADAAVSVWERIIELARPLNGGATGLAARDTLRMEAGMPLYGHELSEDLNPAQTELKFAINLKDREFVGKSAILAAQQDSTLPVRVGLEMSDRRPAREHCAVLLGGSKIGEVTSGTFSPTLEKSISMAYVTPPANLIGTEVEIDIRGKVQRAKVVALPFYKRNS